ncbi:hypothetical protein AB3R30_13330 [Leptolyngbyaceae cyanobacterium UHCC 1019]
MLNSNQGRFFQLICQFLKYFFLAVVGFTVASILSHVLLGSLLSSFLLSCIPLFGRIAVIISCLLAITIIFESIRY